MSLTRHVLVAVCATAFLSACGKEALKGQNLISDSPTPVKPIPGSLEGMSTPDLIRTKYNRAHLDCSLRFARGEKSGATVFPPDFFTSESVVTHASWDLLNDYADEKSFSLEGAVRDSWIKAQVKIRRIEVVKSLTYTNASGKDFKMQYSPVLKAEYSYEQNIVFVPGHGNVSGGGNGSNSINENIAGALIDSVLSTEPTESKDAYSIRLDCVFNTELKPEYKDQWVGPSN
jgi:hypothetical protein